MLINTEVNERVFRPITITLTIDNVEELKALWAYFNVTVDRVVTQGQSINVQEEAIASLQMPLFDAINEHLKRLGIRSL